MYCTAARDSSYAIAASTGEKRIKLPSSALYGICCWARKRLDNWRPYTTAFGSTACATPSFSHVGQRPPVTWLTNECANSCLRTRARSDVIDVTPLIGMRSLPSFTAPDQEGA